MTWTSLHIFHTGNTIQLMQQCISPVIDDLVQQGLAANHFFILYNERGSHVRLRVLSATADDVLFSYVQVRAMEYFNKFPSPYDPSRDSSFYPNDSIQLVPYEPEYSRYGGVEGVRIAEKHFRYSSQTVIACLNQLNADDDNYINLLNSAIKLQLTTCYIYSGNNLNNAILFFSRVFGNVMPGSSVHLSRFSHDGERQYSDQFQAQKNILVPFVSEIWNSFGEDVALDDYVEDWKKYENEIKAELTEAYDKNLLEPPVIIGNFASWGILQSYMHMTNNRLGIKTVDEPLITYLLMRSLMEI